ncbi:hypothetical protein ABI59_01450 [Acidobacteria bacterium Mor1]|nr:hypothetical protein ABI59_01450 [Acidobacteria bacterium Mor1]
MNQRGAALVIVLAISALLLALALALVSAAEIDERIASNEQLEARASALGRSVLDEVRRWFEQQGAGPLLRPAESVFDLSQRRIEHDGDPATPAVLQDGGSWPRYKQGVDRNADGLPDLFRPWASDSLTDRLAGTPGGPDLVIDRRHSAGAAAYLDHLVDVLLGDETEIAGVHLSILRVDIWGPAWAAAAGGPAAEGQGTIRVVSRVVIGGRVRAEVQRIAGLRRLPSAISAPGPRAMLASCGDLTWPSGSRLRFGTVAAAGSVNLPAGHESWPAGWPRVLPATAEVDRLWGHDDPARFAALRDRLFSTAAPLEDPWLRVLAGGSLSSAPAGAQPWPFSWSPGDPPGPGSHTHHGIAGEDAHHANIFQGVAALGCEADSYRLWKGIAGAGHRDARYFAWVDGDRFIEHSGGAVRSFREITDQAEGVLFFDTADGRVPRDDDGDGVADNLTPPIRIAGGLYGFRGVLIVHTRDFQLDAVSGRRVVELRAPGEPFQDSDGNGRHDPGEPWLNLDYGLDPDGSPRADPLDSYADPGAGSGPMRNRAGPAWTVHAAVHGELRVHGRFRMGQAVIVGRILAGQVDGDPHTATGLRLFADTAPDGPAGIGDPGGPRWALQGLR